MTRFGIVLIVTCANLFGLAQVHDEGRSPIELGVDIEFVKVYNGQDHLDVHVYDRALPNPSVADVLVNLHLSEVSRGGMQGSLITDKDGKASFVLVNKFRAARDTIGDYLFIARIANDERFVPINATRRFKKSQMSVDFTKDRRVQGRLMAVLADSSMVPVEGAELSLHWLDGGGYEAVDLRSRKTDADGRFDFQFKKQLMGDSLGRLSLLLRAVHPDQGTIEYLSQESWGLSPAEWAKRESSRQQRNTVIILLAAGLALGFWFWKRKG